MVGRINIYLSNINNNANMYVEFYQNGDYVLNFYLSGKENIIDIFYDYYGDLYSDKNFLYYFYKYRLFYLFKLGNSVLFDCDSINLCGDLDNIIMFYKNNSYFCNSRCLIIDDTIDLDINIYHKLNNTFGSCNLFVWIEWNSQPISLENYKRTVVELNKYVSFIKKFDFSPLEQCLMAYDLVRDRYYVKENNDEEYYISRDLTSVLLGDKIVCVGFSNLLSAILNKLGIDSKLFFMKRNDELAIGHARVISYLVDKKYGIDGVYFFDPTIDCKNNNNYLSSYLFFCKNYNQMKEIDNNKYKYELCNIDFNENGIVVIKFDEYDTKAINALQFLEAFYKVRKNEYYYDSTKYSLSQEILKDVLYLSQVEDYNVLLQREIGSFVSLRETRVNEIVFDYVLENDINKEIMEIKLTKTLKNFIRKNDK